MESNEQQIESKQYLTVEELNIEILPIIYEIIRSIERDPHDNAAKARESQDCSQKIIELQKKLDQARTQIQRLAGVEFSREQQLRQLEALRTQLRLKQDLIRKYRQMYSFSDVNHFDSQKL